MPPLPARSSSLVRLLLAAFCAVCVFMAPWHYFPLDVTDYARWARATGGLHPWGAYRLTDCNYPPLLLYVLTGVEAVRRALHAAPLSPLTISLVKLPSLLACAAGIPLAFFGLRGVWGADRARKAAWAWGLCVPLWYNAGVWGQTDALLAFCLTASVIAALNRRPGWTGLAFGAALALKLMAALLAPLLAVFLVRQIRWRGLLTAAGAGLAGWSLLALPFLLAGYGSYVLAAYRGAIGFMPYRQISALNGWFLWDYVDVHIRHLPSDWAVRPARLDTRLFLGLLSYRALGLGLFGLTAAGLTALVWRRPTARTLPLAAALMVFAFFMLTTEMHERYLVPAAGCMALAAADSPLRRRFYNALSLCALLNQVLRGGFNPGLFADRFMAGQDFLNHNLSLDQIVSALSCALLLLSLRAAFLQMARDSIQPRSDLER